MRMAGRWELPGHDWQANRGAQRAASDLQSAELFSASHPDEARLYSFYLRFVADSCPALLLT
jgi:hypothetical protein